MIDLQIQLQLVNAALSAREQAYAPYSKFLVGAAVLGEDDTITSGANVENASYSLTLCAERVAVGAAVAAGARKLKAIAIASRGGAAPCGACRQVLAEFGPTMDIVLVDAENPDQIEVTTLEQLLPNQFRIDG